MQSFAVSLGFHELPLLATSFLRLVVCCACSLGSLTQILLAAFVLALGTVRKLLVEDNPRVLALTLTLGCRSSKLSKRLLYVISVVTSRKQGLTRLDVHLH